MIQDYHCSKCGKLLFKGSLQLLLDKKASDERFIEPQCPRCGKRTRFTFEPDKIIAKQAPTSTLFD